jgi:hypothetical protein
LRAFFKAFFWLFNFPNSGSQLHFVLKYLGIEFDLLEERFCKESSLEFGQNLDFGN